MRHLVASITAILLLGVQLQPLNARAERKSKRSTTSSEIRVTLFGQPCLLNGPMDQESLKAIHAISPEQIPPATNAEQARRMIEKLKKNPTLPNVLDPYRERMTKRLEAQIAYFDAMANARKSGKGEPLFQAVKVHVQPKRWSEFQQFVKKFEIQDAVTEWNDSVIDQITGAYNEVIESNPEEDFHRAIKRLRVQYACAFEEADGEDGTD